MKINKIKRIGVNNVEEHHWHFDKNSVNGILDQLKVNFGIFMASHILLYGFALLVPMLFLWYFGVLSTFGIWTTIFLYLSTYVIFKPQSKAKSNYWKWFKHHNLWEWAMYRYDWLTIRRGSLTDIFLNKGDRPFLFCIQPHAIYCGNRIQFMGKTFFDEIYPGNFGRFAAATPHFYTPGLRELSIVSAAIDAGKSAVSKVLASGESLYLWVGGSRELLTTDPDNPETKLVITDRKGFVKLAIETGTDIIPVMQFGEKFVYKKYTFSGKLRAMLYALKIPLVLFHGKFGTLFPYSDRNNGRSIRVGMAFDLPIRVNKQVTATPEYMDKIHSEYMERLEFLFQTYKHFYNYEDEQTIKMVSSEDVQMS